MSSLRLALPFALLALSACHGSGKLPGSNPPPPGDGRPPRTDGGCKEGAGECNGSTLRVCKGGAWTGYDSCEMICAARGAGPFVQCTSGECICETRPGDPCTTSGQCAALTTASGGPKTGTCVWGFCTTSCTSTSNCGPSTDGTNNYCASVSAGQVCVPYCQTSSSTVCQKFPTTTCKYTTVVGSTTKRYLCIGSSTPTPTSCTNICANLGECFPPPLTCTMLCEGWSSTQLSCMTLAASMSDCSAAQKCLQ